MILRLRVTVFPCVVRFRATLQGSDWFEAEDCLCGFLYIPKEMSASGGTGMLGFKAFRHKRYLVHHFPFICFAARSTPQRWMDPICQDPRGDPCEQSGQRGGKHRGVVCLVAVSRPSPASPSPSRAPRPQPSPPLCAFSISIAVTFWAPCCASFAPSVPNVSSSALH